MAKIERKFLAHFINPSASSSSSASFIRLGKDLEEYSAELSAEVEKKKNILGETSIMVTSYEKSGTVEPYYAEKGDPLFDRLQEIIDTSAVLDACNAEVVEVKMWEAESSGAYPAVKEKVVIEITSYGGDNTGYQIPFNIHYTGEKEVGTFNIATKTFTAGSNKGA